MDIIFRNRERVHNFFLLTFLKNSWSPLISDSTTENLVEWLTWPSGQTSLYFLSTIADKCKRGGPYQYIYMNRDATKSFFPFTLATTRISWSGRGGCFKHEWSKWRQTEFSRKSGVVFSLKTLLTHTYTQSSKAVSGGKKKHGGIYMGGSAGFFCDAWEGDGRKYFTRTDKNHTTAAADGGDASLLWKPCWLILTHRAPQATDRLTASA